MVGVKLVGRLANQMFQISAAIGYSVKHNMPYFVPQKSSNERIWPAQFKHFPKPQNWPYNYFIWKEPGHGYHEIHYHQHIILDGYFQSEKYFSHCRQQILDGFQIPYQKLEGYVGIHVRRGDYVQYADKHPPVTYEYIADSVKYFISKGYTSFVVCSDDIKWCRINLKPLELFGAVFTFSSNPDPIQDLAMLSCCEHQICANSSFSWWAYWLNQNEEKQGIMPKAWFGPGNTHLETKDIYPENVIIL